MTKLAMNIYMMKDPQSKPKSTFERSFVNHRQKINDMTTKVAD